MKALGIMAGPRKGQITDHLLDEALRGLKEKGSQVVKFYLYDLNIKPCTGCNACRSGSGCVINDDFRRVAQELINSEAIVFASPVYVGNVTSVAKAFFDRGISLFRMTDFGPKWENSNPKRIILVTSCFAPFPFSHILGIIPGCLKAMKMFFGMMKADIKTVYAAGSWDFDSKKCKASLDKAYRLGLEI